jgi:hypothetical protein
MCFSYLFHRPTECVLIGIFTWFALAVFTTLLVN